MKLDATLLFSENQSIAAGTVNSTNVLEIGTDSVANPLLIDVKLSTGLTGGKMTKVKVQSSADRAFTTAVDEVEITVPSAIVQTKPCTVATFYAPIKVGNRFVRLSYTLGTGATGGKVFAGYTTGSQIR
ncbi:MAG: hypothetical protein RSC33_07445 [Vagococcus sp.]